MKYYFDIETLTAEPCNIWLWCMLDDKDNKYIGYDECSLMNKIFDIGKSVTKSKKNGYNVAYVYNLKFEGQYILKYLFENGFSYSENGEPNTFNCFISFGISRVFYSMSIYYNKLYQGNIVLSCIKIVDLYPLLQGNLRQHGNILGYPKGDTPLYNTLPKNFIPSIDDINYCVRDVEILKKQHKNYNEKGLIKLTQASCALSIYKNMLKNDGIDFLKIFPQLDVNFTPAYRGGYVVSNPIHRNKVLTNCYYYDINSAYPYVLYDKYMPYGDYIYKDGYYYDENKLHVYNIDIEYFTKNRHFNPLYNKNKKAGENSYKKYYKDENVLITEVDLVLIKNNCDIINIQYNFTYVFNKSNTLFKNYVDKFYKQKQTSTNSIEIMLAKILLNSLYGKFGTSSINIQGIPYLNSDNIVSFKPVEGESKKIVYQPVAIFVTAYVRQMLFNMYNLIGFDNIAYSDTDSIISLVEFPKEYLGKNLGMWKNEVPEGIKKLKILGNKSYGYVTNDNKIILKSSGFNFIDKKISFEKFKYNEFYHTKIARRVKSGILITDELKELNFRNANLDINDYL